MNKIAFYLKSYYSLFLCFYFTFLTVFFVLIFINWLSSFIKSGNVYVYYFSLILFEFYFFYIFRNLISRKNVVFSLFLGFFIGQLSSILSIFVMSIMLEDGVNKVYNTMNILNFLDLFILYFYQSIVLGAWIFSTLLALLLKLVYFKKTNPDT